MSTLVLHIENMHCGSCVRRVMQTLNALPGTHAEEVRIGSARVTTSETAEAALEALSAAGYRAQVAPSQA